MGSIIYGLYLTLLVYINYIHVCCPFSFMQPVYPGSNKCFSFMQPVYPGSNKCFLLTLYPMYAYTNIYA